MENQITCPNCERTISNNPVVDSAAKGEDHAMGSEFVICECGERISFWAITAQLREQKKPVERFLNWFNSRSKSWSDPQWNIPIACNRATADFMISSPLMDEEYDCLLPKYGEYRKRTLIEIAPAYFLHKE